MFILQEAGSAPWPWRPLNINLEISSMWPRTYNPTGLLLGLAPFCHDYFLFVVAISFVGDSLRDTTDPTMRG